MVTSFMSYVMPSGWEGRRGKAKGEIVIGAFSWTKCWLSILNQGLTQSGNKYELMSTLQDDDFLELKRISALFF